MIRHEKLNSVELLRMIRAKIICFGGNRKLKIYGTLACRSGKRMRRVNRQFFSSEQQAIEQGYRPCGHCMKSNYKTWKMELFIKNEKLNLLPADGTVHYYGRILHAEKSNAYLQKLLSTIEWRNDEAIIFGRHIITKRKAAWYGDQSYSYTYSNTTKQALPWTKELLELKDLVEDKTGARFNSCLLNLYHNGDEGMAWHSDDERSLGKNSTIASLSLGAERKFALKHKTIRDSLSVQLENGSLLVMKDETQSNWLHSLPKTKRINLPRINLTFRTMIEQE
jgi:alkylated DNA repair dioxygenase AlkB